VEDPSVNIISSLHSIASDLLPQHTTALRFFHGIENTVTGHYTRVGGITWPADTILFVKILETGDRRENVLMGIIFFRLKHYWAVR